MALHPQTAKARLFAQRLAEIQKRTPGKLAFSLHVNFEPLIAVGDLRRARPLRALTSLREHANAEDIALLLEDMPLEKNFFSMGGSWRYPDSRLHFDFNLAFGERSGGDSITGCLIASDISVADMAALEVGQAAFVSEITADSSFRAYCARLLAPSRAVAAPLRLVTQSFRESTH